MSDQDLSYKAEAEELRNQFNKFADKVRRMRGWQKEYLKYHAIQDKQAMMRMQREVDNMLQELTEKKLIDKVQLKIFE